MLLGVKPRFVRQTYEWDDYIAFHGLEKPELPAAAAVRDVNAALQKAHSLDILDRRLKSGLQRAMVQEEQLARDLAVFGDTHRDEILQAHDLTPEELFAMLANEKFAQRIQAIRTEINHDTKGLVRARASMYLEAGLDNAYEIANNPAAKDADRMKAIQFLATMADAVPRNSGFGDGTPNTSNGAVNVVFNFGHNHPRNNDLKGIVIEQGAENV